MSKISSIDSVPYFVNKWTREIISFYRKRLYSKGTIVNINGDDVIIKFSNITKTNKPSPELIYTTTRTYKPWSKSNDAGIRRRLNDLDKLLKYYGTTNEWIKSIDTNDCNIWSYSEFLDLQNPNRHFGGETQVSYWVPVDLKITQVFDSTAMARIKTKHYPWAELEVGDEVELK